MNYALSDKSRVFGDGSASARNDSHYFHNDNALVVFLTDNLMGSYYKSVLSQTENLETGMRAPYCPPFLYFNLMVVVS